MDTSVTEAGSLRDVAHAIVICTHGPLSVNEKLSTKAHNQIERIGTQLRSEHGLLFDLALSAPEHHVHMNTSLICANRNAVEHIPSISQESLTFSDHKGILEHILHSAKMYRQEKAINEKISVVVGAESERMFQITYGVLEALHGSNPAQAMMQEITSAVKQLIRNDEDKRAIAIYVNFEDREHKYRIVT